MSYFLKYISTQDGSATERTSSPLPFFQQRLRMTDPHDSQEKEANAMSDRVGNAGATPYFNEHANRAVSENISSDGNALEKGTQALMENTLGARLSDVRVHTGAHAAMSADQLEAKAFTVGSNIVFNKGMYDPGSANGRRLLAHELTHVIQQRRNPGNPVVQRSPLDIHGPVLDRFSAETGTPRDQASPHSPQYDQWISYYFSPQFTIDVLNNRPHTDPDYIRVVTNAPDNTPLWSSLHSPAARVNFIRFLIARDSTNCRPYQLPHAVSSGCAGVERNQEVFTNLCMGFGTQFYSRYNDASTRRSTAELSNLESVGHIYAGAMLPKFRVPVFIAMYPGHAFNAFLIDSDATNITSYIFLEPQNDNLFTSADPLFQSYFEQGIITIDRLTGFTPEGHYQTSTEHTFATRGGVPVHATLDETSRMALTNLGRALHIANDRSTWQYTIVNAGITFQAYFRQMADLYTNSVLVQIFPFFNGRTFARTPGGVLETLDRAIYIDLTGRPALADLIH